MTEYPNPQKCENIVIDEEIVFCLFLVEREVQMRSKSVEMCSEKMVTRLVFDEDKKGMVRKKVLDVPIYPAAPVLRKSEETERKPLVKRINDLTGDRASLEVDKWEVLYSIYGRANVRFV